MGSFCTWAVALFVAVLAGAAHQLDGAPDRRAEFGQADAIQAQARAAAAREAREREAARICHDHGGDNAVAVTLDTGAVVCKTKRGHTVATLARPGR